VKEMQFFRIVKIAKGHINLKERLNSYYFLFPQKNSPRLRLLDIIQKKGICKTTLRTLRLSMFGITYYVYLFAAGFL